MLNKTIGLWHFGTTTYNVLIWISYVSLLLDYSNIWFALNILVIHTNSTEGVELNDQTYTSYIMINRSNAGSLCIQWFGNHRWKYGLSDEIVYIRIWESFIRLGCISVG